MTSRLWTRTVARLGLAGFGSAAICASQVPKSATIPADQFYSEWSGHKLDHLSVLLHRFKQTAVGNGFTIFLAGDSSLDNKYWVRSQWKRALNGYEDVLDPPEMLPDIAYHLNREAQEQNKSEVVTINASVEESMLRDRQPLLDQDRFIMNNISEHDVLIVSVGGNDIALKPSSLTIVKMLTLLHLNTTKSLENDPGGCWGMNYFVELFGKDIETYVKDLTSLKKPKLVLVCMIYYPQEQRGGSWANMALKFLGYDKDPAKLQLIIRQIFERATKSISVQGTVVVAVPLFQVLDGKNPADYIGRVEPSDVGGQKMSKFLWNTIQTALQ